MSAVLQHEMDYETTNKTIRMEVPKSPFVDLYNGDATCVIMHPAMHHPVVHDRLELVEVREAHLNIVSIGASVNRFEPTGREVDGVVTAIHHYGPQLIVSFRFSGRTYPARNQGEAHPEQNAIARRYFGLSMP